MTDTKAKACILLVLAFAAIIIGFATSTSADEPKPTPADYQNLEDIKRNQEVIEETREAHERFMAAKSWNESEHKELAKNGWCVKWDDLTLERCPFALGQQ
jgi:hypothetical protein